MLYPLTFLGIFFGGGVISTNMLSINTECISTSNEYVLVRASPVALLRLYSILAGGLISGSDPGGDCDVNQRVLPPVC